MTGLKAIAQPSYVHKELESEAECRKQFRALPMPSHVGLPLYHRMTQLREARRKQCLDQRKDFLLSTQKPFSFHERERERREKLVEMLSQVTQEPTSKPPKRTAAPAAAAVKICVGKVEEPVASHPDKGELTGGVIAVCFVLRSFIVVNKDKYKYLTDELYEYVFV